MSDSLLSRIGRGLWQALGRELLKLFRKEVRERTGASTHTRTVPSRGTGRRTSPRGSGTSSSSGRTTSRRSSTSRRTYADSQPAEQLLDYPGDVDYPVVPTYAPTDDDRPDPGEVVWAWVPYEEDFSRGKDRPVLVIGTEDDWLLALQLTSQDHDRDAAQEAAEGRFWYDVGSGAWDTSGRPSEVRVNRIIRVDPQAVRRIGARLDQAIFDQVAAEMAAHPPRS